MMLEHIRSKWFMAVLENYDTNFEVGLEMFIQIRLISKLAIAFFNRASVRLLLCMDS